jgi:hypothetical protein
MHHLFFNAQMYIVGGLHEQRHGPQPGEVEQDAVGMQNMRDLGRNMALLLKALGAWRQGEAGRA